MNDTKTCICCGGEKDINHFLPNKLTCNRCLTRKDNRSKEAREYQRRHSLKSQYGITPEEVEALKDAQNELCAICGRRERLIIDHDHETGKVRGMLCGTCNTGLGMFRDNIHVLENAISYLAKKH